MIGAANGKYTIIAGHHRKRAAITAGMEDVWVWLDEEISEDEAYMQLALSNDQSEMTGIEKAVHIYHWCVPGDSKAGKKSERSISDYAERMGIARENASQFQAAGEFEVCTNPGTRVPGLDHSYRLWTEFSRAPKSAWQLLRNHAEKQAETAPVTVIQAKEIVKRINETEKLMPDWLIVGASDIINAAINDAGIAHSIRCNADGTDTSAYDVFDYAELCSVVSTEEIMVHLKWTKNRVSQYKAIKTELSDEAWIICRKLTGNPLSVNSGENESVNSKLTNVNFSEWSLRAFLKELPYDRKDERRADMRAQVSAIRDLLTLPRQFTAKDCTAQSRPRINPRAALSFVRHSPIILPKHRRSVNWSRARRQQPGQFLDQPAQLNPACIGQPCRHFDDPTDQLALCSEA